MIAPDKFRGSLSAAQAAAAIAAGVRDAIPAADLLVVPVADGGEGTAEVLLDRGGIAVPVRAAGALGTLVNGHVTVWDKIAYVESAQYCGVDIEDRDRTTALAATTRGVGEAVAAVAPLVDRVVVTMGGTGTTDGGAGALQALGFDLVDETGRVLGRDPQEIRTVWRVVPPAEGGALDSVEFVVATDVSNPMLGPLGAAAVYGPQKGADPEVVDLLEERLRAWTAALERSFGRDVSATPGAGAAGGLAGGLIAALGAQVSSGAQFVLDTLGVPDQIRDADLVITGEGSLDAQSAQGKVPVRVAEVSRHASVPVWAIVGRAEQGVSSYFDRVGQIEQLKRSDEDGFADAAQIVRRIAAGFATDWRAATTR